MSASPSAFSLHFSAAAWAQVGALDAARFESLVEALEECARRAIEWVGTPGHRAVDDCVPITADGVIGECTINDHRRTVTVDRIELFGGFGALAA